MMSPSLTSRLIEKGIIRINTEVDAYYNGYDMAGVAQARTPGNFTIQGAKKTADTFIFEVRNTIDGSQRKIDCREVNMIDGMEPVRFAEIYGLTEDGAEIKQGKRRGRKPKARVAA